MTRTLLFTLLGVVLGAIGGYLYFAYVGCTITSRPLNSTLYGALLGGLFVNTFSPTKKSE